MHAFLYRSPEKYWILLLQLYVLVSQRMKLVIFARGITHAHTMMLTLRVADRIVHEATIERNAYPSPLNYNYFPKSCCTYVFFFFFGFCLVNKY